MIIEDMGMSFDIPEEMIEEYIGDFTDMMYPLSRGDLNSIRNSTMVLIEMLRSNPNLMEKDRFVLDYVKAQAMREALSRTKMLYDA